MSAEPLSADQIATLRYQYLSDVKEERREWGPDAVTSAEAVAGAATLGVSGLIGPSVRRRTRIVIWSGGTSFQHDVVGSDVSVVAGAATLAISPVLTATVAAGSRIEALPYLKGPWARYHGATYFLDEDIQDLALRADSRWGSIISRSADPEELRWLAIQLLANRRMRADLDFHQAIMADTGPATLTAQLAALKDAEASTEAKLRHPTSRSTNFSVVI